MKNPIRIIIFVELILLVSVICLYFIAPNGNNDSLFLYNFIIAAFVLYVENNYSYIYYKQKLDYWLRPTFIFLIGYIIVGYQLFFDVYIGFLPRDAVLLITPVLLNKGICFSSIGLLAFSIGNLIVQKIPKSKSNNKAGYTFLNIANVLLFLFFLTSVDSSMLSGEAYVGSADDETIASEYLLNIIQFCIIVQYSINTNKRLSFIRWFIKMPHIFLFTLLCYWGIRAMSGDRGPVIYSVISIFLGYSYSTRQLFKKKVIIVIGLLGMTAVTMAGLSRALVSTSLSDKLTFGIEAYKTVGNISISPITMELAGSVRCNQLALKDINIDNSNFHYGEFQLRYLGTILLSNSVVEKLFPTELKNTSSADYLTEKFFEDRDKKFGLGSSCTADYYLDFGIIGMVFCMLFMGCLFKKIDGTMLDLDKNSTGLIWVCLLIGIGSYAIYIPRAVFIFTLRIPLYMFVVLFCNKRLMAGLRQISTT